MPSAPQPLLSVDKMQALLGGTALLEYVPPDALREVAARCRAAKYRKGDVIFRRGEPCNWVYFIQSGCVAEIVSYGSSRDVISALQYPGGYIGEMGVMVSEPYLNTAIAREVFWSLTQNYTAVANFLTSACIQRLLKSSQRHLNAMQLSAAGRLGFILLSLDDGEQRREIRVTQCDLAASAGIARQTAAIILGQWRQDGWIETRRGRLRICDKDALLRVISESEIKG